jgi:5-methylcytosine-specific restriction enzyme subunit McrC
MKSKTSLFIRENSWYQLSKLFGTSLDSNKRNRWFQDAKSKSEQIKRDLGLRSAPLIIEHRNEGWSLKVSGIAGTLKLFGTYLQVAPKFVTQNLFMGEWQTSVLAMLNRARRTHYTYSPIKGIALTRATFLDHIALAYIDALETALKEEPIQVYRNREETSSFLRGRLAVARQMQMTLTRPHQIQCEVDYLETDNQFNHLLHWAGNKFVTLIFDPQVRRKMSAVLMRLPRIAGPPQVPSHLPVWPPPQYKHFLEALEIASVLARGYGHATEEGRFAGYGYILNMEKLFEGFVEKTCAHISSTLTDLKALPQVSRMYATAVGHSGKSYFTRPDNVIYRNGKPLLIVDAKYKQFEHSETGTKSRPQNSDIYQLFASMISHECDRGLLVYPRMMTSSEPKEGTVKLWRISCAGLELLVGAISISVSQLSTKSRLNDLDKVFTRQTNEILSYDLSGFHRFHHGKG